MYLIFCFNYMPEWWARSNQELQFLGHDSFKILRSIFMGISLLKAWCCSEQISFEKLFVWDLQGVIFISAIEYPDHFCERSNFKVFLISKFAWWLRIQFQERKCLFTLLHTMIFNFIATLRSKILWIRIWVLFEISWLVQIVSNLLHSQICQKY